MRLIKIRPLVSVALLIGLSAVFLACESYPIITEAVFSENADVVSRDLNTGEDSDSLDLVLRL